MLNTWWGCEIKGKRKNRDMQGETESELLTHTPKADLDSTFYDVGDVNTVEIWKLGWTPVND